MSTWTSSRSVFWLLLGLVLAACKHAGGGVLGTSSDKSFANPRRDMALPSAELADGALTLMPPRGFCVDKGSLQARFAIVARCDSLGARRTVPDAPLGMIAVSVTQPPEPQVALAEALAALVPPGSALLDDRSSNRLALMHLRGPVPQGADPRHWRGLARIGPHLLSLTAYAPTGGELSGAAGGSVLGLLVQHTRAASRTRSVAAVASNLQGDAVGIVPGGLSE